MALPSPWISSLVEMALQEDAPRGDVTSEKLKLQTRTLSAKVVAKEDLVLCGSDLFSAVCAAVDPHLKLNWHFKEGAVILKRQSVASLTGPGTSLLRAERPALNFLGRLSGIATLSRLFATEVADTDCKILDTRKTTPGYRALEKYAVSVGGCTNHRMNLSDAVLIKENHIAALGGDILKVLQAFKGDPDIEIEVRNLDEIPFALKAGVKRILLDNMTNDQIEKAVHLIGGAAEVEASGGMTLERVKSVAKLGVNFISVGALTHSSPHADFSLLVDQESSK
jgi:nicotinate-nucleotide pyrophosphorylase (carboxylating)